MPEPFPEILQRPAAGGTLPQRGERIHIHGLDRSDDFFLSDPIVRIEAHGAGKHSVLHTATETAEVLKPVAAIAKQYGGSFLRCRQSYLVDPHDIRSIRRFQVTLTDGTVLPVPEKKYTAFKKAVMLALRH